VEEAIASRDARLGERDRRLTGTLEELHRREREAADRDARIELLDGVAEHLARMVVERDRELRGLRALESQVEEIWAQARGQATQIRMQALRQAARLAPRVNGGGNGNGHGDGHAPEGGVGVFDGLVHLEIGPLHDFSQLVRFEDAVTGLGGASEISVKRFSQGRATLAVRLDHPVELLRELEENSPFELKVRSLKDDRLIVDVDER
jgi:hypothetical protein